MGRGPCSTPGILARYAPRLGSLVESDVGTGDAAVHAIRLAPTAAPAGLALNVRLLPQAWVHNQGLLLPGAQLCGTSLVGCAELRGVAIDPPAAKVADPSAALGLRRWIISATVPERVQELPRHRCVLAPEIAREELLVRVVVGVVVYSNLLQDVVETLCRGCEDHYPGVQVPTRVRVLGAVFDIELRLGVFDEAELVRAAILEDAVRTATPREVRIIIDEEHLVVGGQVESHELRQNFRPMPRRYTSHPGRDVHTWHLHDLDAIGLQQAAESQGCISPRHHHKPVGLRAVPAGRAHHDPEIQQARRGASIEQRHNGALAASAPGRLVPENRDAEDASGRGGGEQQGEHAHAGRQCEKLAQGII
mmetsp:Transcript_53765/g.149541  ORF Transcript_53765/g.149541 Transcript_53765/m.149541 type:complete len:364 (+) Transcript_53765:90-1181(+)